MLKLRQILVNGIVPAAGAVALLTLGGCGQKGPLYMPTDVAASQRATLVETLTPFQTRPQTAPPAQLLMPPAAGNATPATPATPTAPASSSPVAAP